MADEPLPNLASALRDVLPVIMPLHEWVVESFDLPGGGATVRATHSFEGVRVGRFIEVGPSVLPFDDVPEWVGQLGLRLVDLLAEATAALN